MSLNTTKNSISGTPSKLLKKFEKTKKVIIANDYLKVLLDYALEKGLEKLSQVAFQYSIGDDDIDRHFINPQQDSKAKQFVYHLKSLSSRVYSPEGQNWFDEVNYKVKKDEIIFYGTHQLGQNFSIFIKKILESYGRKFDFKVKMASHKKTN